MLTWKDVIYVYVMNSLCAVLLVEDFTQNILYNSWEVNFLPGTYSVMHVATPFSKP